MSYPRNNPFTPGKQISSQGQNDPSTGQTVRMATHLGPESSFSSPVTAQPSFPMRNRLETSGTVLTNISKSTMSICVREETRHQSDGQGAFFTSSKRDISSSSTTWVSSNSLSSTSQGHQDFSVCSGSSSLNWLPNYKNASEDSSKSTSNIFDSGDPAVDQPVAPQLAVSILMNYGLDEEDLDELLNYPEEQTTAENLPHTLHKIRMKKTMRAPASVQSDRGSTSLPTSSTGGMNRLDEIPQGSCQPSKVIDQGHAGKCFSEAEDKFGETLCQTAKTDESMLMMDCIESKTHNEEVPQNELTEIKSSGMVSFDDEMDPVASLNLKKAVVAPPSSDPTKLQALPNKTLHKIFTILSLPSKYRDVSGPTPEVLKSVPSKEPVHYFASKSVQSSSLGQGVNSGESLLVQMGSSDSFTNGQTKVQRQGSNIKKLMKNQQMQHQIQRKLVHPPVVQMGQALQSAMSSIAKPDPPSSFIPTYSDASHPFLPSAFTSDLKDPGSSIIQPFQPVLDLNSTYLPFSRQQSSAKNPASKCLPPLAMMHDFAAVTPRVFSHTCSLCKTECEQMKDWIFHQNTSLHLENCKRLREQYPEWGGELPLPSAAGRSAKSSPSTSGLRSKNYHQKAKRESRSHSRSYSPCPRRSRNGPKKSGSSSSSCSCSPRRRSSTDGRFKSNSSRSRSCSYSPRRRSSRDERDKSSSSSCTCSYSPRRHSQSEREKENHGNGPRSLHSTRHIDRSRSSSDERRSSPKRKYRKRLSPGGSPEPRWSPRRTLKRRGRSLEQQLSPRSDRKRRSPKSSHEKYSSPRWSQERHLPPKRFDDQRWSPTKRHEQQSSPRRTDDKRRSPGRSRERQSSPTTNYEKRSSPKRSHERLWSARRNDDKQWSPTSCKQQSPSRRDEEKHFQPKKSGDDSSLKRSRKRRASLEESSHKKKSCSVETLTDRLLENPVVQSLSGQPDIKDMVKLMIPVVLAELANSTASSSVPSSSLDKKRKASSSKSEKEQPKLQRTEINSSSKHKLDKPSPPTMVKLKGVFDSLSHNDVVAAVELFGKTKSVIMMKFKQEATICFERKEDAEKQRSAKNLDVKGVTLTVAAKKSSDCETSSSTEDQKLPTQQKSALTRKSASEKLVLLPIKSLISLPTRPKNSTAVKLVKKAKILSPKEKDVSIKQVDDAVKTGNVAVRTVEGIKSSKPLGLKKFKSPKKTSGSGESKQKAATGNTKRKGEDSDVELNKNTKVKKTSRATAAKPIKVKSIVTMAKSHASKSDKTLKRVTEKKKNLVKTAKRSAKGKEGNVSERKILKSKSKKSWLPSSKEVEETSRNIPTSENQSDDSDAFKAENLEAKVEEYPVESEDTAKVNGTRIVTFSEINQQLEVEVDTETKVKETETLKREKTGVAEQTDVKGSAEDEPLAQASQTLQTTITTPETVKDSPQDQRSSMLESDSDAQQPTTSTDALQQRTAESVALEAVQIDIKVDTETNQKEETAAVTKTNQDQVLKPLTAAAANETNPNLPTVVSDKELFPAFMTVGENIKWYLSPAKFMCAMVEMVLPPAMFRDDTLLLITNLPRIDSYTETDVVNLLANFGFEYEHDNIYVIPQSSMAFVLMPNQHAVMNIIRVSLRHHLILKNKCLFLHIVRKNISMNPLGFYKALMGQTPFNLTNDGTSLIYIRNISPSEAGDLKEALRKIGSVANYLPLLNKVFIEFHSMHDADRLGVWYSFLKHGVRHIVERIKLPRSPKKSKPPQLPMNALPDIKLIKPGAEIPNAKYGIPQGTTPPFWITMTTNPYVFSTASPWFNIPDFLTLQGKNEPFITYHLGSGYCTVMLTGLPEGNYRHEDVAKLVWRYFPKQNLQTLYYNILVLPLQRRAFVYFCSREACCSFVRDHNKKPVSVGNRPLQVHFIVQDIRHESSEAMMYRTLMKWSNTHISEIDFLEQRLLCVELSEMSVDLITKVMTEVASISSFVNFLPLANRICIEMVESSGVRKVLDEISLKGDLSTHKTWRKVLHVESVKDLKQRLQDASEVTVNLEMNVSRVSAKPRAVKTGTQVDSDKPATSAESTISKSEAVFKERAAERPNASKSWDKPEDRAPEHPITSKYEVNPEEKATKPLTVYETENKQEEARVPENIKASKPEIKPDKEATKPSDVSKSVNKPDERTTETSKATKPDKQVAKPANASTLSEENAAKPPTISKPANKQEEDKAPEPPKMSVPGIKTDKATTKPSVIKPEEKITEPPKCFLASKAETVSVTPPHQSFKETSAAAGGPGSAVKTQIVSASNAVSSISTSTADGPAVKKPPAAATTSATTLTFGERIESLLIPQKIPFLGKNVIMSTKSFSLHARLLLITNLPDRRNRCYTEHDFVKLLQTFGFQYEDKNIYILPRACLAFVLMPSFPRAKDVFVASTRKGLTFLGSQLVVQIISKEIFMTPFGFYISLLKEINFNVTDDGTNTIYINNISPDEAKNLRETLEKIKSVKNYMPLLNKVFIEFESSRDADRIGVWYSLLKHCPAHNIYRMKIPRSSTNAHAPRMAANALPDSKDMVAGAIAPTTNFGVPRGSTPPFSVTLTTQPFVFPTSSPWFIIPAFITVDTKKSLWTSVTVASKISTVMLTGLPEGNYRHEDVAKLVWRYFPKQNLQTLYYNILVLPLQRRAFVYFNDWKPCSSFLEDSISNPVSVKDHTLHVHLVLQDMHPGSSEEIMYRSLMKWSNSHVPELESLQERLLCVELSETSIHLIITVMKCVTSIAPIVSFLPLANRICIEMSEPSGVKQVMEKISSDITSTTSHVFWRKVRRVQSLCGEHLNLKRRLQEYSEITINLDQGIKDVDVLKPQPPPSEASERTTQPSPQGAAKLPLVVPASKQGTASATLTPQTSSQNLAATGSNEKLNQTAANTLNVLSKSSSEKQPDASGKGEDSSVEPQDTNGSSEAKGEEPVDAKPSPVKPASDPSQGAQTILKTSMKASSEAQEPIKPNPESTAQELKTKTVTSQKELQTAGSSDIVETERNPSKADKISAVTAEAASSAETKSTKQSAAAGGKAKPDPTTDSAPGFFLTLRETIPQLNAAEQKLYQRHLMPQVNLSNKICVEKSEPGGVKQVMEKIPSPPVDRLHNEFLSLKRRLQDCSEVTIKLDQGTKEIDALTSGPPPSEASEKTTQPAGEEPVDTKPSPAQTTLKTSVKASSEAQEPIKPNPGSTPTTGSAPAIFLTPREKIPQLRAAAKRLYHRSLRLQVILSNKLLSMLISLVITKLPEFNNSCYTEADIINLLHKYDIQCENDKLFIIPEARMAFVYLPNVEKVQKFFKESKFRNVLLKGSKLFFSVVSISNSTPLGFYTFLKSLVGFSQRITDPTKVVYIQNISQSEVADLWMSVKRVGRVMNYLPLLNKVFVEFVDISDADRLGVCYSFLKQRFPYSISRMGLPRGFETSKAPRQAQLALPRRSISKSRVTFPTAPSGIPEGTIAPFWVTMTTSPYVFPTVSPWFNIPAIFTVRNIQHIKGQQLAKFPVIMLTGLPSEAFTHEDVAMLVWKYFPEQNLYSLYHDVVVLPLQRRAFVHFQTWAACFKFLEDHFRNPVCLKNCALYIHIVLSVIQLRSREEDFYKILMKWSNIHVPDLKSLEERLLCVEVSGMNERLVSTVMKEVASIATFVSFLPLANRIYIEMAESSGVKKVVENLSVSTLSEQCETWKQVGRIESLKSRKLHLQDCKRIAVNLERDRESTVKSSASSDKKTPETSSHDSPGSTVCEPARAGPSGTAMKEESTEVTACSTVDAKSDLKTAEKKEEESVLCCPPSPRSQVQPHEEAADLPSVNMDHFRALKEAINQYKHSKEVQEGTEELHPSVACAQPVLNFEDLVTIDEINEDKDIDNSSSSLKPVSREKRGDHGLDASSSSSRSTETSPPPEFTSVSVESQKHSPAPNKSQTNPLSSASDSKTSLVTSSSKSVETHVSPGQEAQPSKATPRRASQSSSSGQRTSSSATAVKTTHQDKTTESSDHKVSAESSTDMGPPAQGQKVEITLQTQKVETEFRDETPKQGKISKEKLMDEECKGSDEKGKNKENYQTVDSRDGQTDEQINTETQIPGPEKDQVLQQGGLQVSDGAEAAETCNETKTNASVKDEHNATEDESATAKEKKHLVKDGGSTEKTDQTRVSEMEENRNSQLKRDRSLTGDRETVKDNKERVSEDHVQDDSVSKRSVRRSTRGTKDQTTTQDKFTSDETTIMTRSTRGRRKITADEIKEKETPMKPRRTPVRDLKKPNKEDSPKTKDITTTKNINTRDSCEPKTSQETAENFIETEEKEQEAPTPRKRGRPRKDARLPTPAPVRKSTRGINLESPHRQTMKGGVKDLKEGCSMDENNVLNKRKMKPVGAEAKRPRSQSPRIPADVKLPPFSPEKPLGKEFVSRKWGYFCHLCSVSYLDEGATKDQHCSSQTHHENLQKYHQKLRQKPSRKSTQNSQRRLPDFCC